MNVYHFGKFQMMFIAWKMGIPVVEFDKQKPFIVTVRNANDEHEVIDTLKQVLQIQRGVMPAQIRQIAMDNLHHAALGEDLERSNARKTALLRALPQSRRVKRIARNCGYEKGAAK